MMADCFIALGTRSIPGYAGPGHVQPMEMNVRGPGPSPLSGRSRLKSPLTAQLKRRIVKSAGII